MAGPGKPELTQPKKRDFAGEINQDNKRAQYHGICSENEKAKTMQFENHVVFTDVGVGEVFGVRTLLDNITCSKYILSSSLQFAE